MIISFIKVGLMIGLTSIGGAIYQTLKNTQVHEIADEEITKQDPIKLLRDYKKESKKFENEIYVVCDERKQKTRDKNVDKEYIVSYRDEIIKNIELCDLELMQLNTMYIEIEDDDKKNKILDEMDIIKKRKGYWLNEENDINSKY